MICPKCKKDTCVLVTEQNKKKSRDKKGIVGGTISLAGNVLVGTKRALIGKRENYAEQPHWNCRYCGHTFKQDEGDY